MPNNQLPPPIVSRETTAHLDCTNRSGDNRAQEIDERLRLYYEALGKWRNVTNLISHRAFAEFWSRQVPDAINLQASCPDAVSWLDFGSGAGLPSVIIAILIAHRPKARVICIEADGRKCAFIREVISIIDVPLRVLQGRAEQISYAETGPVEVVTAKALASVPNILALADPYLSQGAVAALPRGKHFSSELEDVDSGRYRIALCPSRIYNDGAVALIRKILEARNDRRTDGLLS